MAGLITEFNSNCVLKIAFLHTHIEREHVITYTYTYTHMHTHLHTQLAFSDPNSYSPTTLTEVFPCFFLSCKGNARVYLAKTGHGPHSSKLVNVVVLCIVCVECVVLYIVCVQLCTVLLPSGVNPISVNKYTISYQTNCSGFLYRQSSIMVKQNKVLASVSRFTM